MSQPNASIDCLQTMDQESFTQAQLDQLFNTVGTDRAVFLPSNSEASEDINFKFDNSYFGQTDASTTSSTPAPNFSGYNFSQSSSTYSTPAPDSPHPYPIEQQQQYFDSSSYLENSLPYRQRPQPTRSQTNTSYAHPNHASQYTRRRSLSQGDASRIVANPTFLRLQAPRGRSSTPDSSHRAKHRTVPHRYSHSTSQSSLGGQYPHNDILTSAPWNSSFVRGLVPTNIGTPLSPTGYSVPPSYRRRIPTQCESADSNGVVFRHMTRPDQLDRSRRVIELGALAVRGPLDPRLEESGKSSPECVLKKLDEVEQYLQKEEQGGNHNAAFQACVAIREALTNKLNSLEGKSEISDIDIDQVVGETLEIPSRMISARDEDVFGGGTDDNDLVAMLIGEDNGFKPDDGF